MFERFDLQKLVGYLMISVFVTSLDYVLLFALVEWFGFYYLLAATVSYSTAVMTKFVLNKSTIFNDAEGVWQNQLVRFWVVSITGLILTNIGMFVGVDLLMLSYLLTKLGCIGIVFVWTFILHNLFSFRTASNP